MKISLMIKHTNRLTGQGVYSVHDLLPYFDEAIDELNMELGINLPSVTDIYTKRFSPIKELEDYDLYFENDIDNEYKRAPQHVIRNFVCYEAAYRILRDEDEDQEVYAGLVHHSQRWLKRIIGQYSDFELEDTESILLLNTNHKQSQVDDTSLGFYNPYSINNGEK